MMSKTGKKNNQSVIIEKPDSTIPQDKGSIIRPVDFSTGTNIVIRVEDLWKEYRLGMINHGTLAKDLQSGWARVRGKEDPNLRIDQFIKVSDGSMDVEQDRFWALKDVSFEVKQGDVLGIIGKNGAGKSTLLKILSQVTTPTKGEIKIKGRIASLLEVGTGFHPELTGRENIFLNGAILGMYKQEIRRKMDEIVAFSEIEKFIDTPVKRYSSGMYVRLAFAVAAHLDPEILIIDEVLAVGDAEFQKKCLGKMKEVSKEGRTVLFVSHNMAAIQNLCGSSLLLNGGGIVAQGTTRDVVEQYFAGSAALSSTSLAQREDRQGSGVLKFVNVRLLNADGSIARLIQSGQTANLAFIFEAQTDIALDNIEFAVRIDSMAGERIAHFSTEATNVVLTRTDKEQNAVVLDIPKLPLVAGSYSYTIFCRSRGEIADWVQNAGILHVQTGDFFGTGRLPPLGQGSVMIDHNFRLEQVD